MKKTFELILSTVLTICAVAVAGSVVHREFFQKESSARSGMVQEPELVGDWEQLVADGVELGDADGDVRIIEFSDLECPFCAKFHERALWPVVQEAGGGIGVTFVHYPLRIHRFAEAAAHAAECAGEQDRFKEYVDEVFSSQGALGLLSWWDYAQRASVPDSASFANCLGSTPNGRIAAGMAWAEKLGIQSTPTVMVNGWRLPKPPTSEELLRIIDAIRTSGTPFPEEMR
jgi:protein-disulfide isomerase